MNPQQRVDSLCAHNYTGHPGLGTEVDGDTWLTPRWIFEDLGEFDLDPCAFAAEPERVASSYFLKEHDGLTQPWTGRVWMNPPFSKTPAWLTRHSEHGNGISLVPASTESTVWRKVVWPKARAIKLLAGRTRFCNPDGSVTTGRPLRPVALIAWGAYDAERLILSQTAGVTLTGWSCR